MTECGQTISQFYAQVDGVFSNFNSLTNAQQVTKFLAIGNQFLTTNVVVTINAPTGTLSSTGITAFATLLGEIAFVDCGEEHLFSQFVIAEDNLIGNSITIWFNEVSFTNASPTGFCAGAINGR